MKEDSLPNKTELLLSLQRNNEKALALLMHFQYNDLYNYATKFTPDDTPDNYNAAFTSMGGDGLTQRIFWDKP
jgi:hypothetical protein